MKRSINISFLLLSFMSINLNVNAQQNMIFNYDFEVYFQCPDNLGQVDRCWGFFNLIEHGDYSNCNFDVTQIYPSDTGAYSGTGFMTIATYGNPLGAAEAIAQVLNTELDSGIVYDFGVVAKKANGGQYSGNCGGVSVYGFDTIITGPNWNLCPADLPGAVLLGKTDTINNFIWAHKSFTFQAPFAVKSIAISPACAISCFQVIFIDSISISTTPAGIINPTEEIIDIFPIPSNDMLKINFRNNFSEKDIFIYNITGKLISSNKINSDEAFINVENFPNGFYFMKIKFENKLINRKFIVRH